MAQDRTVAATSLKAGGIAGLAAGVAGLGIGSMLGMPAEGDAETSPSPISCTPARCAGRRPPTTMPW